MRNAHKVGYINRKSQGGRKYSKVPFIRLSGKQLEKHGFGVGTEFIVVMDNNKITLEKI